MSSSQNPRTTSDRTPSNRTDATIGEAPIDRLLDSADAAASGTTIAPVLDGAAANPAERAAAQRKIVNRLRRAHGQLAAVIKAVESDAHCKEVVQQLNAVSKALDRAGFLVVSTALRDCVANPDDSELDVGELEKLFLSLA